MGEVDWSFRAEYMRERHGIEVESANEALEDPDALRIDPDPASRSGRSVSATTSSAVRLRLKRASSWLTCAGSSTRASAVDERCSGMAGNK